MAQALQDILKELNAVYQPQKDVYNQQLKTVDPQQQAEEQGLNAAKTDAFQQITDQANRRGLFYAGLPIAEEQRYTGQQFLPSLANLRAKYSQQKFDLSNALNKITADQYTQAYGIRQHQLDMEEQAREEAARLAAQERASRAAAAAATPSFDFGSYLDGQGGYGDAGRAPAPISDEQRAYNHVKDLIDSNNHERITSNYASIFKGAKAGNKFDQIQLQLLNQLWLGQSANPKKGPTSIRSAGPGVKLNNVLAPNVGTISQGVGHF